VVVQSKEMDYYGRGLVSREAGFLCAQRQKDEATLLPRTMQEGIEVGYRQALIETHLETETSHERVFVGVQHGVRRGTYAIGRTGLWRGRQRRWVSR
jgi:hypothetical protein